jgi:hypothetical protein
MLRFRFCIAVAGERKMFFLLELESLQTVQKGKSINVTLGMNDGDLK